MPRKKKTQPVVDDAAEVLPKPNADWIVTEEFQHNGRWLRPGTEFTVTGVRGRLRFQSHTKTPTAEWIDCFSTDRQYRAFYPHRIKTVHSKNKTRENSNA